MEEDRRGKALFAAADRLIRAADFQGAIHLLHEILAESERERRPIDVAKAFNRIGRSHASLGNADLAIRYHLRALTIFEKAEDLRGLAETYNHIGSIWSEAENSSMAMQFKLKALDAAQRSEDLRELSRAYNNIGEEYRLSGRLDDARDHYVRSLELDRRAGNKAYEAVALHNLALVAAAEGNYDEARDLFEKSLALSLEAGDREMEVETLIFFGGMESRFHRFDSAGPLLDRALAQAEDLGSPYLLGLALREMAAYLREKGDFPRAFDAMDRFTKVTRGESSAAQRKRFLSIFAEMEADRTREESRRLESEAGELKELIAHQVREIESDKEEALRLRDQAHKTLEELLLAMASAIEAKDLCTGDHVERVGGYARALARCAGLPQDECQRIYLGAIVHDVGKIGVRDAVLNKPGILDPEEREEMRRHSALGRQILSQVRGLETAADIAHCHQECWDGGGYPQGLRGTEIPLSARIVTIADVWDAITSHRPYRPAMSREKALKLMISERGRAFDPDLLDLFIGDEHRTYALYDRG